MEPGMTVGIWHGNTLITRIRVLSQGGYIHEENVAALSDVDVDPWAGNVVDSSKPFNPVINFREDQ